MRISNIIKRLIQIIIGLLLIFIIYKIGLRKILEVLQTINITWIIPIFLLVIPIQFLASVNFDILLRAMNKRVLLLDLIRAVTLSFALGKVSPFRMGEFSLILFLKKRNVSYGEGLAIALLDKLITFIIFTIMALIGVFVFFNLELFLVMFLICVLFVLLLIFFIFSDKMRNLLKKYLLRKYAIHFKGFSKTFKFLINKRKKYLLLNFIITFIKWIISFYSHWFIFKAFGLEVPLVYIVLISSIVKIISLIPISFSGLGIREASGTYLYSTVLNVAPAIAVNVMLIETAKVYLMSLLFYLINFGLLQQVNIKLRKSN